LLWLVSIGLACTSVLSKGNAQEDPFGVSDPFGDGSPSDADMSRGDETDFGFDEPRSVTPAAPRSSAGSGSSSDPLDRNIDPLILILRENPPITPKEFGRALNWMTSLGHWSEAAGLLDQVAAKNWSLPRQVELARSAGASTWIRLRRENTQLSPIQLELVNQLFQAPANLARDRSSVDQWIAQLGHADAEKRRMAQLRLQDGGSTAIERLTEHLLRGDGKVPDVMLVGTIVEFGQLGIEAIRAACSLSDATVTSRILLAIAELSSNHFPMELAVALHSQRYSQDVKDKLAERLKGRKFRLPNRSATASHVLNAFNNSLQDYQDRRTSSDQLLDIAWSTDEDGARVVQQELKRDLKSLEQLYQIAQQRAILAASQPEDLVALGAVGFQRAYQKDPQLQNPKLDGAVLANLPPESLNRPEFWIGVFRQADSWEMHGSCVRSLHLLTQSALAGKFSPPMDFLSELLIDPRPIIRYMAMEAVAELDPRVDYEGSERALATAVEMLQLNNGAATLVIGANSELCMTADAIIQQITGGEVAIVTSGREALQALTVPNPTDLIVVADRVHDMSLFELLQRLRKTQNGASLPIAVMTDQLYAYEQQYLQQTPGVFGQVLSKDPEAMRNVVQQMLDSLDTQPISDEQRQQFRQSADAFLAKISEDRATYAFYPFDTWHDSLMRLPSNTTSAARTQVLASLSSHQSQMRLVQLVVASGATQAERTMAARAFEKSIRRFGNLLTAQDVQTVYDLYNRLGPKDPVIAEVMTYVLDVIEAQAGARAWPSDSVKK